MGFLKKMFGDNDDDKQFDFRPVTGINTNSEVHDAEVQQAIKDVETAEQQVNYAADEFLDAAIAKLNAAEAYLNALLKYKKTHP